MYAQMLNNIYTYLQMLHISSRLPGEAYNVVTWQRNIANPVMPTKHKDKSNPVYLAICVL